MAQAWIEYENTIYELSKNENEDVPLTKPKIAFICTHNSCRSQIAEALGKHLAGDVFESYSAGTQIKDQINPDAVRLLKKIYGSIRTI